VVRRVRIAPPEHREDVANRRAVERRDDADAARQHRQRTLALGREEAFGLELPAQLIERQLQRAEAARFQPLADELILALRVVDGDASAGDDVHAVLGREPQRARR